jgi:hypothetical protein
VDECGTLDLVCGVYSSASQWGPIFGGVDYSYGANLPLWCVHACVLTRLLHVARR